jgi:hypothetical protein
MAKANLQLDEADPRPGRVLRLARYSPRLAGSLISRRSGAPPIDPGSDVPYNEGIPLGPSGLSREAVLARVRLLL